MIVDLIHCDSDDCDRMIPAGAFSEHVRTCIPVTCPLASTPAPGPVAAEQIVTRPLGQFHLYPPKGDLHHGAIPEAIGCGGIPRGPRVIAIGGWGMGIRNG